MPRSEHLPAKEEAAGSATTDAGRTGWRGTVAMLPGIGLALLPKLTCPACWPAYAGVFSSLGLGFVNYSLYLLPLTALFLIPAVVSLGLRAKNRRGYGPLTMGTVAALILLIGKFLFASEAALYAGIALLTSASLWNSWPLRKEGSGSCPACASWNGGVK
ncbi:MerC family mercury resistance protein [Geobacter argillaceus]|uniref:MerC mercury resistance protein n=1 Tax=Geobacter argillaceus TaxID=345631 RepID=A0A562WTZ7_9BACT|nr:MerC family mercury resistance protein [Geobacter argillaceus]TWJ33482.1 hypothetical protein JN12_00156 [Geobacter argillaceus]